MHRDAEKLVRALELGEYLSGTCLVCRELWVPSPVLQTRIKDNGWIANTEKDFNKCPLF